MHTDINVFRVENEKQPNQKKQQQNNRDSIIKGEFNTMLLWYFLLNVWIIILASVQSNLKRKKQLLHLISLVLLQLKGNPGKHLLIKENS